MRTLTESVEFSGIGLHCGNICSITLKPYENGIVFKHDDYYLKISENSVKNAKFCTCIENDKGQKIFTVEHLLSTLSALEIDSCLIECSSFEIPILDGSSQLFYETLKDKVTGEPIKPLFVNKKIVYTEGDKYLSIEPSETLSIDMKIDFGVVKQNYIYNGDYTEIYNARTFCFDYEIMKLHENGLALGGNLFNALILDKNGYPVNSYRTETNLQNIKHLIL